MSSQLVVVLKPRGRGIEEIRLRPGVDGFDAPELFFAAGELSVAAAAIDTTLRRMTAGRRDAQDDSRRPPRKASAPRPATPSHIVAPAAPERGGTV